MTERKQITVAQLAKAKQEGLNFILDNIEVTGVATVKDKYGNVKGTLQLGNKRKENASS